MTDRKNLIFGNILGARDIDIHLGLQKNIVVSGNMDKKIGSVGRFFLQWCL